MDCLRHGLPNPQVNTIRCAQLVKYQPYDLLHFAQRLVRSKRYSRLCNQHYTFLTLIKHHPLQVEFKDQAYYSRVFRKDLMSPVKMPANEFKKGTALNYIQGGYFIKLELPEQ